MAWYLVLLLVSLAPVVSGTSSCSDHDGSSCGACVKDSCTWCDHDKTCHSSYSLASCGKGSSTGLGAWIKYPLGCEKFNPLVGEWSGEGKKLKGCTNPEALNYKFKATIDDGSCAFAKGQNQVEAYEWDQQRCICSDAGDESFFASIATPYGRFCGAGYTGAPGQQPCDPLDKCCQIYDWCGTTNASSCDCLQTFEACIQGLEPDAKGFCSSSHLQTAAKSLLNQVSKRTALCTGSPDVATACNPDVNCGGKGQCTATGKCVCEAPFGGYDCSGCVEGKYPPGKCDTECSAEVTCKGNGKCNDEGKCVCSGTKFGAHCDKDQLGLMVGLGAVVIIVTLVGLVVLRGGFPAFNLGSLSFGGGDRYFTYDPLKRNEERGQTRSQPLQFLNFSSYRNAGRDDESVSTNDLLGSMDDFNMPLDQILEDPIPPPSVSVVTAKKPTANLNTTHTLPRPPMQTVVPPIDDGPLWDDAMAEAMAGPVDDVDLDLDALKDALDTENIPYDTMDVMDEGIQGNQGDDDL